MNAREDHITKVTFLLLSARGLCGSKGRASAWDPQAGWISREDAEQISVFACAAWDDINRCETALAGPVCESEEDQNIAEIRAKSAFVSERLSILPSSKVAPSGVVCPQPHNRSMVWQNLLSWFLYFFFGIILPDRMFRATWDIVITTLLAFISVALPFTIAFNNDAQWSPDCPERWPGVVPSVTDSAGLSITSIQSVMYAIDGMFAVDILINFRTAFIDDDACLVTSHRAIAGQYVRTWFVFDFIAIFPFDAVLASPKLGIFNLFKSTRLIKLAKVLRILKVMKMLKLLRLPRIFSTLRAVVGKAVISMVMLFLGILMVTHFAATFFYYIANEYAYNKCEPNWITSAGLFVGDHYHTYITALYWALSTMTTVGYGDIVPGSATEQIASMIAMGIGVSLFSYLIGSLVSMLAALQKENSFVAAHKEKLEQFIKTRKTPMGLASRMRTYYNYALMHSTDSENVSLITSLSYSLRCECVLHIFRDLLPCVPILCGRPHAFAIQLVSIMVLEFFAPDDVIIEQGSFSDTLYIMVEGPPCAAECRRYKQAANVAAAVPRVVRSEAKRMLVVSEKEDTENQVASAQLESQQPEKDGRMQDKSYDVVTEIGPKQAFGEHTFFTGKQAWSAVVAMSCCQAQTVRVGPFCQVLHEWPDIRHDIMVHAMRLSTVTDHDLERQEKGKFHDILQKSDSWQEEAYADEFDPRDQEFRL